MMAKGNKGFGSSLTAGLDDEAGVDAPAASEGVLASRTQSLARIAAGKVVTDRTEWVDPARCRPWRLHNRDVHRLTEESCRDLIDAFLSSKKQRIPAIVRRLKDDPEHDFEIIAGVRRWWTVQWLRDNHHPDFEYLVTIQTMTDEEAFRVSDIENRSRKDISDWERAKEYARALEEFYGSNQSEMATHLNISRSWLSRLLDVARLPEGVVAAFEDPHLITVRIARELKPLAANPLALEAMTEEGRAIANECRERGGTLSGPEIAKRLIQSTMPPKKGIKSDVEIKGRDGRVLVRYSRSARGALTFKVPASAGSNPSEVLDAIAGVLKEG